MSDERIRVKQFRSAPEPEGPWGPPWFAGHEDKPAGEWSSSYEGMGHTWLQQRVVEAVIVDPAQPDEKVKSAEEPTVVVTEAERAFFEKFEDIAVRLWNSEAARLQGKVDNFEAWGLNTARQHGWKGESSFESWDYIDSVLERSTELESQLAEGREREAGAVSFLTRAENAERELQGANNQLWGKTQEIMNLTNELAAERAELAQARDYIAFTDKRIGTIGAQLEQRESELAAEREKGAKALQQLVDYFRVLHQVETNDAVEPAWVHAREMCEATIEDLVRSSPPAVPAVAETAEKPPEAAPRDPWAAEEDRRIFLQASAPDNPSAEQLRQAHAVHYEEPPPASAPVERLTRKEIARGRAVKDGPRRDTWNKWLSEHGEALLGAAERDLDRHEREGGTMSGTPSDPAAPTIFGRAMTRWPNEWGWVVWSFQIPGAMRVRIWGASTEGTEWHWCCDDADHVAGSVQDAAHAIEKWIRGLAAALSDLVGAPPGTISFPALPIDAEVLRLVDYMMHKASIGRAGKPIK